MLNKALLNVFLNIENEKGIQTTIYETHNQNMRLLARDLNNNKVKNLYQNHLLENGHLVRPIDYLISKKLFPSSQRFADRLSRYLQFHLPLLVNDDYYVVPFEIKKHLIYKRTGRRSSRYLTHVVSIDELNFDYIVDIVEGVYFIERTILNDDVEEACKRIYIPVHTELAIHINN